MPLNLENVPPAKSLKSKPATAPAIAEEQQALLAKSSPEDQQYLDSLFENVLQRYVAELPTLGEGERASWCVGHKHESSRNCSLNCAAIDAFGFVNSGVGTDEDVTDALHAAATAAGLEEAEATATLDSARGAAEPKDWRRILDARKAAAAPVDLGQETEEHAANQHPFPNDIFTPQVETDLRALAEAHGDTGACLTMPAALSALSAAFMGTHACGVSPRHAPCPSGLLTTAVKPSTAGSGVIFSEITKLHMEQDKLNVRAHERAMAEHQERVEEKKQLSRQQRRHPDINIAGQIGARPAPSPPQADVLRPPKSHEYVRQNITQECLVEVTAETEGERAYVVDDEGTNHQIVMGSYGGGLGVNDICRMHGGHLVKFARSRRGQQGLQRSTALFRPLFAATSALQYNKAAKIARNRDAFEQGYVARYLWSACKLTDKTWEESEGQQRPSLAAWEQAILPAIRRGYLPHQTVVTANADALKLIGKLHNRVREQKQPGGVYAAHRPFAGRVVEHTCRIAVVLQLLWQPESTVVTAETMERAVRVIEFFEAHYIYLFGAAGEESKSTPLARFLRECCTKTEKPATESSAVLAAFVSWCAEQGFEPLSAPQFGRALSDLGVKSHRANGKTTYPLELI